MPQTTQTTQTTQSNGLLEKGNINLYNRPHVKNSDGSVSTVKSISIGVGGKEILIPTVSDDGRIMSKAEAIKQYQTTRKHLGVFKDVKSANSYAEQLHNDYADGKYDSNEPAARFGEYLNQVFESPFYKKGDANLQKSVREKLYETKLKPFYTKYGLALPDRDYFVNKDSSKILEQSKKDQPSAVEEGVTSFATEVAKTGGKVIGGIDKLTSPLLREYFADALIDGPSNQEQFRKAWDNVVASGVARNKVADNLNEMGQRGDEWSEDNHVDDLKHSVGMYGGMLVENVAEFEAVLSPLKAAGVAVGGTKYLAGISKVLQNSQRGRLGLHILANASTAYSIDKLKGEDNSTALKGAGYMVAGDLILHGGGKLVKGFFGRVASVGGRPLVEDVMKGMDDKVPPPDKLGKALVKTGNDLRDKIAQEMFGKNFADILNIQDKGKVNKAFREAAAKAPASKAATNKTAVKAQVVGALDTHKKASLQFKQLAGDLEAANPRPTEDVVTTEQVTRKEAKNTVKNATKLLTTSRASIDDLAKSVGSAGVKDPVFLNNLADLARAGVPSDIKKIEGHKNKVAFLWTVRKELPKQVVKEVIERMKEFFPNTSVKDWDIIAKNLTDHVKDMRDSGHVNPNDKRGIFRSTNLTGQPTKWQSQLSIEAEVANLKKQTKRKDVQVMLDSLNRALRKQNPDTEALGERLDEIKAKAKELAKKPLKGVDKVHAVTPNITGTQAEKAVDKATAKLDAKRTAEQQKVLKDFLKKANEKPDNTEKVIKDIEQKQKKKPKSVGAAAINDPFAFKQLISTQAPKGNYAAIVNALPSKGLSDLIFGESLSMHKEAVKSLINNDVNFRNLAQGITIYTDGSTGAYEGIKKAARYIITGDEVGAEHFITSSPTKEFPNTAGYVPLSEINTGSELSVKDVTEHAKLMVESIRQSEPHPEPLYRGVFINEANRGEFLNLRRGDSFSLDRLSSFTNDRLVANRFTSSYEDKFIFQLETGAKALKLQGLSILPNENEFITQGEFQVTAIVQKSDGTRVVHIKHTGVY